MIRSRTAGKLVIGIGSSLDDEHKPGATCGRFIISTGAMPGEALLWNAFRYWKITTQLCDLPRSIQFYVPFWGQIPKIKSHNSLIFNKLNQKASPAFAPNHPISPLKIFFVSAFHHLKTSY